MKASKNYILSMILMIIMISTITYEKYDSCEYDSCEYVVDNKIVPERKNEVDLQPVSDKKGESEKFSVSSPSSKKEEDDIYTKYIKIYE